MCEDKEKSAKFYFKKIDTIKIQSNLKICIDKIYCKYFFFVCVVNKKVYICNTIGGKTINNLFKLLMRLFQPTTNLRLLIVFAYSTIAVLFTSKLNGQTSGGGLTDFSSAPNSYLFDPSDQLNDGLYIPLEKPYQLWKSGRYFKNKDGVYTPIPDSALEASVYWEDVNGLIKSVSIDQSGGSAEKSKIKVIVDKSKGNGNAVIAFKVNGTIYWSWHIWVTDSPETGSSYAQGFETDSTGTGFTPEYMDRNLGAKSAKFLGDNWQKSGGLMYQWGRKDPIPPLVYKDGSFYEVTGEVGSVRHNYAANLANSTTIPVLTRGTDTGSNDIDENIMFSVKNPLNIITHPLQDGTWFSDQEYKINDTDTDKIETWDLWSDNGGGKNTNANSSDPNLAAESKSYELKSEFDPCPNGWRVPSHYGRNGTNNNLNPFGRKNSSENDDILPSNNTILPTGINDKLVGIKVYPGLGFDFSGVSERNLGLIPINGNYEYYGPDAPGINYAPEKRLIYQDQGSDGGLHLATYGVGGSRNFFYISSSEDVRLASTGINALYINQVAKANSASGVRCMRDPNFYNFPTEFVKSTNTPQPNYAKWIREPNSFVVMTGDINDVNEDRVLRFSINKAYAMQDYLGDSPQKNGNINTPSVEWTSNKALIKNIKIIGTYPNQEMEIVIGGKEKGNAVVAFRNGNNGVWGNSNPDKILWSWHIWAPVTNPLDSLSNVTYTTESIENGGIIPTSNPQIIYPTKSLSPPLTTTFMDRNLGALYALPSYLYRPNLSEELKTKIMIQQSGGLQYQWGRKDPMPSFHYPGGTQYISGHVNSVTVAPTYNVFRQINTDEFGNVIYDDIPVTESTFMSTNESSGGYSREWNTYKTEAGISNNDPKNIKIKKILKYAVENPLSFMFRNKTGSEIAFDGAGTLSQKSAEVKDWLSDENGQFPERWGHANEKSPFDPCPSGWRVPDTSTVAVFAGNSQGSYAKGNSPWFYNGYNTNESFYNYGIAQNTIADLTGNANNNALNEKKYPGFALSITTESVLPSSRTGWVFNSVNTKFHIGNIPTTGIRGMYGGNDWKNQTYAAFPTTDNFKYQTGLWTSSMADYYSGFAIGLNLSSVSGYGGKLASGSPFYPQAAMGVRCVKYTERYMADLPYTYNRQEPVNLQLIENYLANSVVHGKSEIKMYPNPVSDFLYILNDKDLPYKVFDTSGRIMLSGNTKNKKIDMSSLTKGLYLIQIYGNEVHTEKIFKK